MKSKKFRISIMIVLVLSALFCVYQFVALAATGPNNGPNPVPTPGGEIIQESSIQASPGKIETDPSPLYSPDVVENDFTHYVAELNPGESVTFTYRYTVPQVVFNRGDIMFVFDRTGSMGGEINQAKTSAIQIMNSIRQDLPYAWFGLGSFMDYPGYFVYDGYAASYGSASYGDVPWAPGLSITKSITNVANAINGLTLGYGADEPEDYTRALYETRFSSWRADSKKIVVLFGDAPTHDLDFAGYNYGGDPGRDATANTSDDLDFETVVSQLITEGISVVAVDSGYTAQSAATFKGMSIGFAGVPGTGGLYYNLSDTTQLPEKVVELIREETSSIDRMQIEYTPDFVSWVSTDPPFHENLMPDNVAEYVITVTVPNGTSPGFYPFMGTVEGDGQILKLIYFEITVPGAGGSLDMGFRPGHDGYSFKNFTKTSSWYTELSWDMFRTLYGQEQVEYPDGDPMGMAQYYYDHSYKTIGGEGNCDGFSSTSMFNFLDRTPENAGKYALPHYSKLWDVKLNATVRDSIEFAQGIQSSLEILGQKATMCEALGKSPKAFFNYLKSLFSNDQAAVVGIQGVYNGKKFSHALLPYRLVEDPAHHRNYIYVYENEDPKEWWDTERRIEINTQADTWSYDVTAWIFEMGTITGNNKECNLQVVPLDLYTHKGVPVWDVVFGSSKANTNQVATGYKSFVVDGPVQLLFIDDIGHRLGWQDDIYYEEILGGQYIPFGSGTGDQGGIYLIPEDIHYTLTLIGSDTGSGSLDYWHGSNLLSVRNIELLDGLQLRVVISGDENGIEIRSLTDPLQVDILAAHQKLGEDVALHVDNMMIEAGKTASLGFGPVSELDPSQGDLVRLSSSNLAGQNPGIGLIHRGGEGYSAFSSTGAVLEIGARATMVITDWQSLSQVSLLADLNGDGIPDTTQTLVNSSQANEIDLQADRTQVYPSETIQIMAVVRDQLGMPVNNGTPVQFQTTLGKLSTPDGVTSGGQATVDLLYDGEMGIGTVTVSIPGTEISASIEVVFLERTLYLPVVSQ